MLKMLIGCRWKRRIGRASLLLVLPALIAQSTSVEAWGQCTTPEVDERFPVLNATDVPVDISAIWVHFNTQMDPETINDASFRIYYNGWLGATVDYNANTQVATLEPDELFPYGSFIQVWLNTTIESWDHCPIGPLEGWSFRTESVPPEPPCQNAESVASSFTNIHLNPDGDFDQSETSVAVSPTDPNHVLVGANLKSSAGPGRQGWSSSQNGAVNWDSGILVESVDRGVDPAVAFDTEGNAYFCFLKFPPAQPPEPPNSQAVRQILLAKSQEMPPVWLGAAEASQGFGADKPHLAIDIFSEPGAGSTRDYIYAAWTEFNGGRGDIENCNPGNIIFRRSTNKGISFDGSFQSISQNVADEPSGECLGVNLGVGPDGALYAVWTIMDNGDENPGTALGFSKSLDGGDTWGTPTRLLSIAGIHDKVNGSLPPKNIKAFSFPVMAIDPSIGDYGIIYVVWPDLRNTDSDIFLISSDDGGASWQHLDTPIRVNRDPFVPTEYGADQWLPWVCVDSSGGVNVVFYDCRNDQDNYMTEVWLARSSDTGKTFTDFRISDVAFAPCPTNNPPKYIGEYIGIASTAQCIYPCWMDNRFVSPGEEEGVYQVHMAPVRLLHGSVSSSIPISGTWILAADATIEAGENLTIQGPAEIWVDSGTACHLDVYGSLTVSGTESDSVVFHSIARNPSDEDWFGIVHHGSGNLTMEYARIENAYKGLWIIDTTAPNVTATIDHCEFRDGYMSGVWVEADPSSSVTISNSLFEDIDYYGVQIYKGAPTVENNTFSGDMLNAVRVEGGSSRVTGGLIKGNTFDNLTKPNLIAVNLQSIYDDARDYSSGENVLEDNVFGPNWSTSGQVAVQVYDCPDPLRFYRTRIAGENAEKPGYGIMNFNTRALIYGSNASPEYMSQISHAVCGLYCISSMPGEDFAKVRQCSFDSSRYNVYVYSTSDVDLGDFKDYGNSAFYGYIACDGDTTSPGTYINVCNKHVGTPVGAVGNWWKKHSCSGGGKGILNPFWPYVEGGVVYTWDLLINPFAGPLRIAVQNSGETPQRDVSPAGSFNYPNPFNASTVIRFAVEQTGPVDVAVYNILGQQVRILTSGIRDAGHYEIPWDGRDRSGRPVASGVYFYRIVTPEQQISKKMVVLK